MTNVLIAFIVCAGLVAICEIASWIVISKRAMKKPPINIISGMHYDGNKDKIIFTKTPVYYDDVSGRYVYGLRKDING